MAWNQLSNQTREIEDLTTGRSELFVMANEAKILLPNERVASVQTVNFRGANFLALDACFRTMWTGGYRARKYVISYITNQKQ